MPLAIEILAVFVLCFFLVMVLRKAALLVGLVDMPGDRKQHHGAVPLTGGLAVFLSLLLSYPFWTTHTAFDGWLLLAMGLLLALGVWDDYFGVEARRKAWLQAAFVLLVVGGGGLRLTSLGAVAPGVELTLGPLAGYAFTVVAVFALINAVNMLDGMDGLAAGYSVGALVWLTGFAAAAGLPHLTELPLWLIGALAAFLIFNMRNPWRRKAAIFLGDAGSLMVGAALALLAIRIAESQTSLPPAVFAWLFALPVYDAANLFLRRLATRRHPFCADREHLHHVLERLGIPHHQVVYLLVAAGFLSGGAGYGLWRLGMGEAALFWAFVGGWLAYVVAVTGLGRWADARGADCHPQR